jgi:Family of unknown function (DUF6476)
MSVVSEPETSTSAGTVLPGTVFTARQVRILKIAVIVMGVLLVGGFAFVLAAIVYQASHVRDIAPRQAAPGQGELNIDLSVPAGSAVTALALDGNRLAVHLDGAAGPEIAIVDLASGKVVAHVKLKPQ